MRPKENRLANRDVFCVILADVQRQPHLRNVGHGQQHRAGVHNFTRDHVTVDDQPVERRADRKQIGSGGLGVELLDQLVRDSQEVNPPRDFQRVQRGKLAHVDGQAEIHEHLLGALLANLGFLQGRLDFAQLLQRQGAVRQLLRAVIRGLFETHLGN